MSKVRFEKSKHCLSLWRTACLAVCLGLLFSVQPIFVQSMLAQQDAAGKRRLMIHSAPEYPGLARSMALQGVVKVDALVGPDGAVKDVAIKGGHPVLAQAALNTVRHWKWEPAGHESHEIVEVKFSPPED